MIHLTPKFIFSIVIYTLLSLFSHAELEQKLVPINDDDKKVTLTLFHYNTATNQASILTVVENIGSTISKFNGKAAISIPQESGVSVIGSKVVFSSNAKYLVNEGKSVVSQSTDTFSKHTFILSNGKKGYILGYAPLTSIKELTHAIQHYMKSNKLNYHTAILLNSGNNSAFYKENGDYHPYYLKELNTAKQMLMVK